MTESPPGSQAILDFLLSQVRISTFVCSRQKHEHGYTLQPRVINDYNLIFLRRGRAAWVIDGEVFEMRPGDLVLVPPRVRHHAFSRTNRVTIGSIHVEVTLPGGQDVFEMLSAPRIRRVASGTQLDRYLAAALEEWDRNDDRKTILTMPAWGRLVALELLRHDSAAGLLRHRPIDPIVSATIDELARRIDQPITLSELAKWAGYSPQYLNRSFRAALGTTPLKYLMSLRLDRAAAMLSEGKFTIRHIAQATGFPDPYYFSRLFRQHFRCSPSQYRADSGSNSPDANGDFSAKGKS